MGNNVSRPQAVDLPRTLPDMPKIGLPESFYAQQVQDADRRGDRHAHEAYKVGQYVTLAMDPTLDWDAKLRYFKHALHRHCQPPPYPNEPTWLFYRRLAELVRQYAGQEALRLASVEDDLFAARISMGQSRDHIEDEAERFFARLIGGSSCQTHQPEWLTEEDWQQLKLLRDQWI
jgi:hypothetical protein